MTKRQARPQQEKAPPEKVEAAPVVELKPEVEPEPKEAPPKDKRVYVDPKQIIAAKYGVELEQVVKWRMEDGQVVALIDYGIKGTKKYKFPIDYYGGEVASFEG